MSLISVDNNDLTDIAEFTASWNDLDSENTGRSEGTGILTRERIRASVYQLDISFNNISDNELSRLQSIFAPESVNVVFWIGKNVNARMYAAGGSAAFAANPDGSCYWNFSISLTEF